MHPSDYIQTIYESTHTFVHMRACQETTSARDSMMFARDSILPLIKQLSVFPTAKMYSLPLMNNSQDDRSPLQEPIRFIVKCPEEGCMCPITQELITSDETFSFDLDHPDRTAIRLACQHEFSAFWVLFNWVHNNHVKCPLCRAGPPDACIDIAQITPHVRVSLQRYMRKLAAIPIEYNSLDEVNAARHFVETVVGESFLDSYPDIPINDLRNRLECWSVAVSVTPRVLRPYLSSEKSKVVCSQFMEWVKCDPVKNTPNWNGLDLTKGPRSYLSVLPLELVVLLMDHVMKIMYGLSFTTRYDNETGQTYYTVFNTPKSNAPFQRPVFIKRFPF